MPRRVAMFGKHAKGSPFDRADRPSASARGYGRRWRMIRLNVLAGEPLCRDPFGVHRAEGRVVAATDVDHVEPRRVRVARGADPDARDNLQALCRECHSRKTATEDGGFRR